MDDLNHWVGHLGRNAQSKTPNIDRLARRGVTFTRAYCAAPVCNPSRAALISGLRPGSTGVYDNGQDGKAVIGKDKTLTTQFLNAGYGVYGSGKIYHANAHRRGERTDYRDRCRLPRSCLDLPQISPRSPPDLPLTGQTSASTIRAIDDAGRWCQRAFHG